MKTCSICNCDISFQNYMVKDKIWIKAKENQFLCIICLENIIERKLEMTDFTNCLLNFEASFYFKTDIILKNRLGTKFKSISKFKKLIEITILKMKKTEFYQKYEHNNYFGKLFNICENKLNEKQLL